MATHQDSLSYNTSPTNLIEEYSVFTNKVIHGTHIGVAAIFGGTSTFPRRFWLKWLGRETLRDPCGISSPSASHLGAPPMPSQSLVGDNTVQSHK